jgi:hypothetical protein
MSKSPETKTPIPYRPHLAIRLVCWFAIYLAASYLVFYGSGIKFKTLNDFWASILVLPYGFAYFIVGIFGLPSDLKVGYFAMVFSDGFYLLHLVLSLSFHSQKIFWSLFVVFIVIVFITLFGHGCYYPAVFEEIPPPQSR